MQPSVPTPDAPRAPLPLRFASLDHLSSRDGLEAIVGPVQSVERSPLPTIGFSRAHLDRVTARGSDGSDHRFVLKRFSPSSSWTAYRTGDAVGREGVLLQETVLAGVWDVFRNPYRAFALEDDAVGLLMDDLTESLLPDEGSPLGERHQEALLASLAKLHALFWQSSALETPWLAPLVARFHILHPTSAVTELQRSDAAPVFGLVQRGWKLALETVSPRVAAYLRRPAAETARDFEYLPATLLHGDAKAANFAFHATGTMTAFDWATMGRGPLGVDLGYCLAINGARLSPDKESVIARYRGLLQTALGRQLPDDLWEGMVALTIVAGASMVLWAKALAVQEGAPGAAAEWNWWVAQLERRLP